jgi:hypothetical protein
MVLDLMIIGLAITLDPLAVVPFTFILGSERGVRKGLALILGWMACLVLVIAVTILVTGGKPPRPHTAPSTAALAVKALLGVVLIRVGVRRRGRPRKPRKQPAWMAHLDRMSLWTAAGLGAFLQPWTLVGAGAATIVDAQLSTPGEWLTLVLFCLLATSSFLAMEVYAAFRPKEAAVRFGRLQTWIDTHQDQAIVAVSLVVGAWLLGDSLYLLLA